MAKSFHLTPKPVLEENDIYQNVPDSANNFNSQGHPDKLNKLKKKIIQRVPM